VVVAVCCQIANCSLKPVKGIQYKLEKTYILMAWFMTELFLFVCLLLKGQLCKIIYVILL
jgi:hypothetical protein